MPKILRVAQTVRHLKFIQIRYQIWYRFRHYIRKILRFKYPLFLTRNGQKLELDSWINKSVTYSNGTFRFLNLSHSFSRKDIDWDFSDYGKLWTYNLNYFDYLNQKSFEIKEGEFLIKDFLDKLHSDSIALEPYPIALRGINWIKFLSKYKNSISDEVLLIKIDSSLYAQYQILINNLEYHLLGNHLLEDGFSLLFGAYYFHDKSFINIAKKIIEEELDEQVLIDGGHFELSPMYHQIILDRLLDSINLLQNNQRFDNQKQLLELMQEKALKMLDWLDNITFANGQVPLLNDAAPSITPTTEQLNNYAASLNLQASPHNRRDSQSISKPLKSKLGASGYRKFISPTYECIIDIGQIGPSYQPGHSHADTFNFVINVKNESVLVDTGISTYNTCKTRLIERGTASHNTVTVQDKNSSEVWSSFRVARRAKVKLLKDDLDKVVAIHNGYRRAGSVHRRKWQCHEDKIIVTDELHGKNNKGTAHLHFAPGIVPEQKEHGLLAGNTSITFEGGSAIHLLKTKIPNGYNQFRDNYKVEVYFENSLKTIIKI